jgi:hypothetical protein
MYGLRGLGQSTIPSAVVGSGMPSSSSVLPSASLLSSQGIKAILFPTFSGEAGGVQLIYAAAGWGAIGLIGWMLFGKGKR